MAKQDRRAGVKIKANAAPVSAKSVEALAYGFAGIMKAGYENHCDQVTIQAAIKGFADIASRALIDNTHISNSTFTSK